MIARWVHGDVMKPPFFLLIAALLCIKAPASTISVVPIFEPLSLQGTDVDEAVSDSGESLQACIASRPMAMSGDFPEALVEAIRSPHLLPSNNPNYKVQEANLLVLCNITIDAEMTRDGLDARIDVSQLAIPPEVDLTARQILKLAIGALRKTLEAYQLPLKKPLNVYLAIVGADDAKSHLRDLASRFTLAPGPAAQ
ncbi:MAG: hypothetical protein ACK49N_02875 [Verrucomicrobiota bacterium]